MKLKILIIDIDSKIQNLALKKIEKYHLDKGDEIIWNVPLFRYCVDKIYVSCIFSWNKDKCKEWGNADIGGSGYDLKKELPPEIDKIKPLINMGFTTRGCIRNCPFCIVPIKEGMIRIEGDIYDIWDKKSKEIVLLDNNILALPDHFKKICSQLRKEKLKVDINQGMDIRLLTDELAQELKTIKHIGELRFAWDNVNDEDKILKGIDILKRNKCKRAMFYVIVGFNSTIEEDFYRFNVLKKLGQRSYCMRHEKVKGQRIYNDMASWVNQQRFFNSMTFDRFQECRKDRSLVK